MKTHGLSHTQEYHCWRAMIARCTNPEHPSFKDYGARGITLCDRWRFGEDGKSGLECFLLDMGKCPSKMTIERRDNALGYSPENCCWAARREQMRNTRRASQWGTGVRPTAGGKWRALIRIDGVMHHLGNFDKPRAAQQAYDHTSREITNRREILIHPEEADAWQRRMASAEQ